MDNESIVLFLVETSAISAYNWSKSSYLIPTHQLFIQREKNLMILTIVIKDNMGGREENTKWCLFSLDFFCVTVQTNQPVNVRAQQKLI